MQGPATLPVTPELCTIARRALLRCHPPPNQHKLLELAVVARDLGFTLDVSSAGALQVGGACVWDWDWGGVEFMRVCDAATARKGSDARQSFTM